MNFVLCPRCELNYMPSTDKYCKVCMQEMHSEGKEEEVELCSICNENPVLPGRDVCMMCLKEMSSQTESDPQTDGDAGIQEGDMDEMDDMGEMDEMDTDMSTDEMEVFPDMEEDTLSLERVREDEEREQDDSESDGDDR